jgi:hypothetical protein
MALTDIDGQRLGDSVAPKLSNRNKIFNGAMQVAQRGTSFTGITSDSKYPADRFKLNVEFGTFSAENSSTSPAGFSNSIKIDCTTLNTSPAATNENFVQYVVEAQDLQDLKYGESGAESITISFYVRSNKTGSYGIWVYSEDGSRQYATTYSISAAEADTWVKREITIPGDTSGTINDDNGAGFNIRWYLGAGSSYAGTPAEAWEAVGANRTTSLNFADSASNEWFLSGVQLEVGNTATPFEHRSYGDELARCQRYCIKQGPITQYAPGYSTNARGAGGFIAFPTEMRDTPTVDLTDITYSGSNTLAAQTKTKYGFAANFVAAADNTTSVTFTYTAEKEL